MIKKNYFKNGKVYICKETFAIIKSKKPYPKAFANITDKNETTVIIEQSKYNEKNVIEIEKDWKILTFDMVLPFGLVGFLAKVSKVPADEKYQYLPFPLILLTPGITGIKNTWKISSKI